MWDAGPDYADLINGTHEVTTYASAWYGGQLIAELEVEQGSGNRIDTFDGRDVRRTIEGLTILDPNGVLTPRRVSDALAPFGQRLVVRQKISLAGGRVVADYPLGEYLIASPDPTNGYRRYHHTHLPTGGVVVVSGLDRWEVVQRSSLLGLWQAKHGATIRTEVRRIMRGIMPVLDATIPNTDIPPSTAVHPESNSDAIRSLLERADRVPHVDRQGRFAPLPTSGSGEENLWHLSTNEQTDVGAIPFLRDDEIYNQVATTGESDDLSTEILAIASETGRLAPGPEFGWRAYKHHSPVIKTQFAAVQGANTRLANLIRERTILYRVFTSFDPARDVLDPVELTIIPLNPASPERRVRGLVTGLRHSLAGGEMTVEVSIPWTEAEL